MAWGRYNNKQILRGVTKHDVEKKILSHQERGWMQISEIQTENRSGGAYAVLMEFPNKKHA